MQRMANVQDFLDIQHCHHNQYAIKKESWAENKQITAVGYVSGMEEMLKASCALFQHDGVAEIKLSERSPLRPAVSVKDLPAGRTEISNIFRINSNGRHRVGNDKNTAPDLITDCEHWLKWNSDLDNPNDRDDD